MFDTARGLTRRQALRDIGLAGLGAGALGAGLEGLLTQAATAAGKPGSLKDIEHVVILMQENRSFDHYFGTLSGVRGYDDKQGRKAFAQLDGAGKKQQPFRLPNHCYADISHEWTAQHRAWNHGHMDHFLRVGDPNEKPGARVESMGYYKRADLSFYYALADAFTICDGYFCSVIGPTDPNRLMSMSASIDPAGTHGGPLLETLTFAPRDNLAGHFTWTTMPERLQAHGVSWKVYTDPALGSLNNVLSYFKPYKPGSQLHARGLEPTFPNDFLTDLQNNSLPSVSWLLPGVAASEHPQVSSPVAGELATRQIVEALLAHPKVWARTALFITWDENGGFFDHVVPPTPPPGTKGEYLTVASLPPIAGGFRGPVGLGFRVPMLVVSPFSRGGLVCSDVLDHTSTLRFLEKRFGVEVPNLSHWRRSVTGDLTGAFNFAAKPRVGGSALPSPGQAPMNCGDLLTSVPAGAIPRQEKGKRKRPSGIVKQHAHK